MENMQILPSPPPHLFHYLLWSGENFVFPQLHWCVSVCITIKVYVRFVKVHRIGGESVIFGHFDKKLGRRRRCKVAVVMSRRRVAKCSPFFLSSSQSSPLPVCCDHQSWTAELPLLQERWTWREVQVLDYQRGVAGRGTEGQQSSREGRKSIWWLERVGTQEGRQEMQEAKLKQRGQKCQCEFSSVQGACKIPIWVKMKL